MKKLLSILLALMMALGLLSTTAWAEGEVTWTDLTDTVLSCKREGEVYLLNGGNYKLVANITLMDYPIKITGEVTLDLNGKTISKTGEQSAIIVEGGTLTLQDSGSGGEIKAPVVTGSGSTVYYSVKVKKDSTFIMQGGTVATVELAEENATMQADGGTVTGKILVGKSNEKTCTITASNSDRSTTFAGTVTNYGIISGGTFEGTVNNYGTISGGTFKGTVVNGSPLANGTITGGTFYGEVTKTDGSIKNNAYVTVKFSGTELSDVSVLKGQKVEKPADPTREGHNFVGWYNGDTVYDFSKAVTDNLTLTAKWEEIPSEPEEDTAPSHTPIRRQNTAVTTTEAATDTTKVDTVTSAKTFDVGTAVYSVLAVASLLGMGYVSKKR